MTLLRLASARTFSSLRRHRNYRLFFAGQLTSVAGTWMQNIAMAWLVVQLAPHSRGLAVGILTVCRFGPFTVLGLVAGVVTDRLDNRRTVIVTQTVQMFFSAVLAVITLVGHVQLWEVYAIAALTGIALVFDAPARQNLTFQMVGRDELPNAVALNSSLFNMARIFGPALAGILIAAFGAGWCFALNTLSFLAVLAGLLAMRVRDLYPLVDRRRPTLWRGTREGFAYARRNRTVLVILAMMVVFSSVCFNFNILLPLLAKTTLDAGPRTFGIISACFGAGALDRRAVGRCDREGELEGDVHRRRRLRHLRARARARSTRRSSPGCCSSSAASSSRATPPTRTPRSSSRAPTTSAAECSGSTTTRGTASHRSGRSSSAGSATSAAPSSRSSSAARRRS